MINNAEILFDEIGKDLSINKRSSMFGVICYKINRKPFIMFYKDELVCKLFGEVHKEACQLEGTSLFNPKGNSKAMSNWVQLPYTLKEKWLFFASCAYEFVKPGANYS